MAFFYAPKQPAAQPAKSRRGARPGERHHAALLSDIQVKEIKRRIAGGERTCVIARDYAVGDHVIYAIRAGKSWRHVALEP